jgi:hypothetical protein
MNRIKTKKSILEKELERLYDQGFSDGISFQKNALNENRRIHPIDRAMRRIRKIRKS